MTLVERQDAGNIHSFGDGHEDGVHKIDLGITILTNDVGRATVIGRDWLHKRISRLGQTRHELDQGIHAEVAPD